MMKGIAVFAAISFGVPFAAGLSFEAGRFTMEQARPVLATADRLNLPGMTYPKLITSAGKKLIYDRLPREGCTVSDPFC